MQYPTEERRNGRGTLLEVFLGIALALGGTAGEAQPTSPVGVDINGLPPEVPAVRMSDFVPDTVGDSFFQRSIGGELERDQITARRPHPSASELNFWLDYESWDGQGLREVDGDRFTLLTNYTWGLDENREISVTLPLQRLQLDRGFGTETGLNDTELAYRHYLVGEEQPLPPIYIVSGRVLLPTGDAAKGIGLGEWGGGISAVVLKPLGRSLGYLGAGYTFFGEPDDVSTQDAFNVFLGGMTPTGKQWLTQFDISHFESPFGEDYTRLLIGWRRMFTPTAGLQLNFRQEFQADGDARSVSLGYVVRY